MFTLEQKKEKRDCENMRSLCSSVYVKRERETAKDMLTMCQHWVGGWVGEWVGVKEVELRFEKEREREETKL